MIYRIKVRACGGHLESYWATKPTPQQLLDQLMKDNPEPELEKHVQQARERILAGEYRTDEMVLHGEAPPADLRLNENEIMRGNGWLVGRIVYGKDDVLVFEPNQSDKVHMTITAEELEAIAHLVRTHVVPEEYRQ